MKVRVKFKLPVLTFETGETEVEIKKEFKDITSEDKVKILEGIGKYLGTPQGVEDALAAGSAYLELR